MSSFFARHSDTLITLSTIIIAFVALVTFIDHRLSVQDKLIDMRFNGVDERFNSVDERFNSVDERFNSVDQRFDAVDQRFDAVDRRFEAVNQRFDAQDRRIDDLKSDMNRRLDRLTNEVLELRKLTVGIIERVSRNEGEIDVIREQLQIADKPAPRE